MTTPDIEALHTMHHITQVCLKRILVVVEAIVACISDVSQTDVGTYWSFYMHTYR